MKPAYTPPLEYQRLGVARIQNLGGRALLADDMGLGKTYQVGLFIRRNPEAKPVVVVCPYVVKLGWQRELLTHFGQKSHIIDGKHRPGHAVPDNKAVYIINYDILPSWWHWLQKLRPKLVVIDECQHIKNPRTKRTKAVRWLAENVPYVIATSGTPLISRPIELFPTINLIRPDIWPSLFAYAARYCQPKLRFGRWEYKGASHTDELREDLLKYCMIRRRAVDVLKDLPERRRSIIPLKLKNQAEYDEAYSDFVNWLAKISLAKAFFAEKSEALTKFSYLKRLVADLKLSSCYKWIDEFLDDTDEKLVLFAEHRAIVARLHARYNGESVFVNGSVTGKARHAAAEQFTDDPKTRLFIGNTAACGIGLNGLQYKCAHAAFIELALTPGQHAQAEARLVRMGQKRMVTINYLLAHGTIEEKICKLLHQKQNVLNEVLDGTPTNGTSQDVFNELLTWIKKGKE